MNFSCIFSPKKITSFLLLPKPKNRDKNNVHKIIQSDARTPVAKLPANTLKNKS